MLAYLFATDNLTTRLSELALVAHVGHARAIQGLVSNRKVQNLCKCTHVQWEHGARRISQITRLQEVEQPFRGCISWFRFLPWPA